MEDMRVTCNNPILCGDFPDPDVIRVGDTYYMVSTTMHFMPGAAILQSFDLVNWEMVSHIYDTLEDTPGYRLDTGNEAYGQGMWAPCIRYHNGVFYVNFTVNDIHKSVLFTATDVKGPWKKSYIEGFYYDSSLLFDDDGRVYIVHGNRNIWITELKEDLTGPEPGGLNRNIINDLDDIGLGYEGSHIYKIDGKYYIFLIHWPEVRTEACFVSASLEGEFVGKDILADDMGYHRQGVAQGGIVNTPDGDWYAMLFQDHGAVGRIPVLVPMHWEGDWPVLGIDGKAPKTFEVKSTKPNYEYAPLYTSDDFSQGIGMNWEWNHNSVNEYWKTGENGLTLTTDRVVSALTQSVNTLTMRMKYPSCAAEILLDGTDLKEGDYAGICALQSCYGMIALTKRNGKFYIVMQGREEIKDTFKMPPETEGAPEYGTVYIDKAVVRLRLDADFTEQMDEAKFSYEENGEWKPLGITKKLSFKLDHFTGCRFGLFCFSTKEKGGSAVFEKFDYIEK